MITKPLVGLLGGVAVVSNEFITEWNIPAGSFTFPAGNAGTYNATIDWGDGSPLSTITAYNDANLTHTYSSTGTYQIKVNGDFPWFYINNNASINTLITKVIQWGDVGFESLVNSFYGATNLSSIPAGPITGATAVTSCSSTFRATGLSALPTGLFDNLVSVTNFNRTFQNCALLAGILHADLFRYNTLVKSFYGTFYACYSIKIPSGLFDYNTAVINFTLTFYQCFGINAANPIPSGLFDNNTLVESFGETFRDTNAAIIPTGLFDNCTAVTNFNGCFRGTDITAIPTGIFDNNTSANNFSSTFNGCSSLTGDSDDLWIKFPAATGTSCYTSCTGLSDYSEIPADWGGGGS